MTCPACNHCITSPRADRYVPGCDECKARALAAIGAHIDSEAKRSITPRFREVLEEIFGAEWRAGAAKVKRWAEKMDSAARRKKKVTT